MNKQELHTLASSRLFTIGAHTVNHPMLSNQKADIQEYEISKSTEWLQEELGTRPDLFAYPHGRYDDHSKKILLSTGHVASFTTHARPLTRQSDPYAIGRYQVVNSNRTVFQKNLSRWRTT